MSYLALIIHHHDLTSSYYPAGLIHHGLKPLSYYPKELTLMNIASFFCGLTFAPAARKLLL